MAEPETRVFDRDALFHTLGEDEELFTLLLATFIEDVRGIIVKLQQAVDQQDASAVRMLGHTLRGIASSISAWALHDLALQVHAAGEAGDLAHLAILQDRLELELARFEQEAKGP